MQLLLLLFIFLTGCGNAQKDVLRIGVDTKWYPLDLGAQTSYVNGFTEDLLLKMAHDSGMEFQLVYANWDALLDGLREKKYDAIFTSMPPYEFHAAKYDFSVNLLDLGPVLITKVDAKKEQLKEMEGDFVGIIQGDPAVALVEKHPKIIIREFLSIPDLLNAVAVGEIEAALLPNVPAVNYVGDLYAGSLKIVGSPMTDQGLHLVGPKGSIAKFDRELKALKAKKSYSELLVKWQFSIVEK